MELNKEIRDILIEFAMIIKEENYTSKQVLARSTYDTFRIQNIVEKLPVHDVSNRRELLTAFRTWWWGNRENATDITNNDLDRYFGG